ncbi:MAG: pantetheine-phosphate adenylyltransferase [Cytophagales bacterium]|nr:pantetheine-phosphate adenylyltransferase [Armatimonadota bacterium]
MKTPEKALAAVYPGSFDPATNGHLDVIERAATTFDRLVVAVGRNSTKTPLFTPDERVEILRACCTPWPNVSVTTFDGMLVNFARERGARVLIKGLRAVSDFEYEFQMALANRHLAPDIETLFLMAGAEHLYLSSSIVKEIARLGGDIAALVPPPVEARLKEKFARPAANPLPAGDEPLKT